MNHSLSDCIKFADETEDLILKKNAVSEIADQLKKHFSHETVCIVSDENTQIAAGKKAEGILRDAGIRIDGIHIFPGTPRLNAEYDHIRFLKQWISSLPSFPSLVPIAIGAGTLNDLVKRSSFELDLQYICIPTATSVDGFTPNGASLLMDGFKQTLPCPAPKTLIADTDIIVNAPSYLSSSGFGDLASKIISGTDWMIADRAGTYGASEAHAIVPIAWEMVQNGLLESLQNSINASRGDADGVNALFEKLSITGFAMQYMKNSRPVSGSEHLWSHVWEMETLSVNGVPVTHGHKVTIGTLAATAFTEIFFKDPKGPPAVSKDFVLPGIEERKAEVSNAFKGSRAHDKIIEASMAKLPDEKTLKLTNEGFRDTWKNIRDRVLEKLLPYKELKDLLYRAGCPITPKEIGISRDYVIATARRAQMIRNKYCILDLSWNMGNFESILSDMEKSGIYLY